jgi:hypothetical protein
MVGVPSKNARAAWEHLQNAEGALATIDFEKMKTENDHYG